MEKNFIDAAVEEATRFLDAVGKLEKEAHLYGEIHQVGYYRASKQTGALRRASMDLTRALANLRQGRG